MRSPLWSASAPDLALDSLAEMVQQTDCPNLYWALTDLPFPLVDLRKSVQGHRLRSRPSCGRSATTGRCPKREIETFVRHLSGVLTSPERAGLPPTP